MAACVMIRTARVMEPSSEPARAPPNARAPSEPPGTDVTAEPSEVIASQTFVRHSTAVPFRERGNRMFPSPWLRALSAALLLMLGGCANRAPGDSSSQADLGSVWFQLAASSENGTRYWLVDATFRLSGPEERVITADAQDTLRTALVPGEYTVQLLSGWRLIRLSDGRDVSATLGSENPVTAPVRVAEVTPVTFVFDLQGGGSVGFGDLEIGIVVREGADDEDPADPEDPPPDGDDQVDSDRDGVPDVRDNCPTHANASQDDRDGDGLGDACDVCPADPNGTEVGECESDGRDLDSDFDGVTDADDNCPLGPNAEQRDVDRDGVGDVCDNCPFDANAEQEDGDHDAIGDVCECVADGRCE